MSLWFSIKSAITTISPFLGRLIGGPLGEKVGDMIASALGVENTPQAVAKALSSDPNAAIKIMELQSKHAQTLAEIAYKSEELESRALEMTNETMRVEYQSQSTFKTAWRPLFGYVVAVAWFIQTAGIVVSIMYGTFFDPDTGAKLLTTFSDVEKALSTQWIVALSVLGINISKTSKETFGDKSSLVEKCINKIRK